MLNRVAWARLVERGKMLQRQEDAVNAKVRFALGDIAMRLDEQELSRYAAAIKLKLATLLAYRAVAEAWPRAERRDNIPWSIYLEIMNDPQRFKLLRKAPRGERWTVDDMRDLRGRRTTRYPPPEEDGAVDVIKRVPVAVLTKELNRRNVLERQRRERERNAQREKAFAKLKGTNYALHHSEIGDLAQHLYKNSIDAIVTDAPYRLGLARAYDDLGWLATEVLKKNGLLLVLTGHTVRFEAECYLREYLNYEWTCALLFTSPSGLMKRWIPGHKPILCFTKGEYKGLVGPDVIQYKEPNVRGLPDKTLHPYAQSLAATTEIVARFTSPGQTILDPFCGSATTGEAALRLGRHFIGGDHNKQYIDLAADRLGKVAADVRTKGVNKRGPFSGRRYYAEQVA